MSFVLGSYDHSRPLVIDPVLSYSTFLGGSSNDSGNAIAVDATGNVYVTGTTSSPDFPTANALQTTGNSNGTAFVTKLSADGSTLVYSTFLGGSGGDGANAIAVDSAGSVYITGSTKSSDFPTAQPLQAALQGSQNAFVAKLTADGSALVYSTYLGGSGSMDAGSGIAVDAAGNAYVTGSTDSPNFPTVNAFQSAANPNGLNVFVTKLKADGSGLVYSTFLSGSGLGDFGTAIAVDAAGNAYVTGFANSADFPIANAVQPVQAGFISNAFVTKLTPDGSSLVFSTFLGGFFADGGTGIAVDMAGNAYVTGFTLSPDFPTVNALQTSGSAFAAKLTADGSALVYSTHLGGSGGKAANGIAVDAAGDAYITGYTLSADFPTVNPFQPSLASPNGNAFVLELTPDGSASSSPPTSAAAAATPVMGSPSRRPATPTSRERPARSTFRPSTPCSRHMAAVVKPRSWQRSARKLVFLCALCALCG